MSFDGVTGRAEPADVREVRLRCSHCERFITMLVPLDCDLATLPTDGQCSSPEICYPRADKGETS